MTDSAAYSPRFHVAILLFDDVELLDFAGPFEVFWTASRMHQRMYPDQPKPFEVFTVAQNTRPIHSRGRVPITPHYTFEDHPTVDVLIVPGGVVDAELEKPAVLEWIRRVDSGTTLTASVCTGAFLLGKLGLLAGRTATTHWEDVADLRRLVPNAEIIDEGRYVDQGRIVTSAGISAGIDMALHLVERLTSRELAARTARQMDYRWNE